MKYGEKMSMAQLEEELTKLKEMEEKTPEIFKQLDSEFWILVGLKNLYQMAVQYEQLTIPEFNDDLFVPVKRVIRSKIGFPNWMIRQYSVDCTLFMGFFLATEGYYVHKDLMENLFNSSISSKRLPDPETIEAFGVPDDAMYWTVQRLPNDYGFMLKKNEVNDLFKSWTRYDYLYF